MVQERPARVGERVILVIEDDPECRLSVQRMLREQGWRVYGARHGQEALAIYQAVQPDVVFVDVLMQGGHGDAFVQQLQAIDPHATVFAMTGVSEGEPRLQAMRKTGLAGVLTKPFSYQAVHDILESWPGE
jgi:DNA-binding NtrC family response regulator